MIGNTKLNLINFPFVPDDKSIEFVKLIDLTYSEGYRFLHEVIDFTFDDGDQFTYGIFLSDENKFMNIKWFIHCMRDKNFKNDSYYIHYKHKNHKKLIDFYLTSKIFNVMYNIVNAQNIDYIMGILNKKDSIQARREVLADYLEKKLPDFIELIEIYNDDIPLLEDMVFEDTREMSGEIVETFLVEEPRSKILDEVAHHNIKIMSAYNLCDGKQKINVNESPLGKIYDPDYLKKMKKKKLYKSGLRFLQDAMTK